MPAAFATYLSLTTPLFAVMYWLTAPNNRWGMVLIVHLALTLCFVAVTASVLGTKVSFDGTVVTERAFLRGRWRVSVAEASRALLVDLYQAATLDSHRQLFLLSSDGRVLLRLRGQLWEESDIDAFAAALGAPVERLPGPLTRSEVKRLHPGLLRWFER